MNAIENPEKRQNRKILVVTGKRGGWGAIIPTMKELSRRPGVEVVLVATDQHLYEDFGATFREVEAWFEIRHLAPMDQEGDRPIDRTKALARCMDWMASVFQQEKPDILLILGDRGEILSVVVTAIHFQIPVAHIQGGDRTGNIDEFIRHAITKMAHLHFPSTQESADRIIRMGEEPWRVHVVGDTHLDMIRQGEFTNKEETYKRFSLDPERPLMLVLHHSDTCNNGSSYADMKAICDAVNSVDAQKIFVYPCTDSDYGGIIRAIEECRGREGVQIHRNIECRDFWGLQNVASVFLGNSSAGIIETPVFGIPSITIGNRQRDRQRADNCISVNVDSDEIRAALERCLNDEAFREKARKCESPYGEGKAYLKIADVLSRIEVGPELFNKRMTY